MVDDLVPLEGPDSGMGGGCGFHRRHQSGLRGSGLQGRGQGYAGVGSGRSTPGVKAEDKEWILVTKLGCLVKDMKIKSLEEIYLFSLPIKESEIINFFLGGHSRIRFLKIMPATVETRLANPTVPCKVTGYSGSVLVWLIPAPTGTGIISAPVPKKLLLTAGIDDCYTSARGCTATLGNFAKVTFDFPYQEFTDHLVKTHTRVSVQRTQAPAVATI
uniref:Small ribosomal subunit protein uS5 n=1 Tax=Sciurus vulgaris TaxID=55149 RepID=A0A8D2CRW6_SCIVU